MNNKWETMYMIKCVFNAFNALTKYKIIEEKILNNYKKIILYNKNIIDIL